MSPKKSGWLYLAVIASLVIGELMFKVGCTFTGKEPSVTFTLVYSEGLILLPALLFVTATKEDIFDVFRLNKVKLTTLLLTIPFVYLLMPLMATCNAFTLLFTDNAVAAVEDKIVSKPFAVMFFIMAIYGPFVEEAVFRGAIYSGLKKSRRILAAIIIQALMFGLMHMNLNQLLYAFVMGLFFGMLSEATNSILPSFLGHMIINGSSTFTIYAYNSMQNIVNTEEKITKVEILAALIILKVIAKNETGGIERLERVISHRPLYIINSDGTRKSISVKIVNIPMIAACITALIAVIIEL